MTTMQLSMLLRAEGTAAAKAAVEDVRKSTEGLRTATTSGAQADTAAAAAKRTNAQAATQLATANRQAAGATGNLFAQFQDIGVMMAAGQNPLQLAIQQGSQISQVIGPMGAGGAVRALGAAFMQLLNPINFITIGLIAAGAATFQWLTGASEETKSFEDSVGDLSDQADTYVAAIKRARLSTADLRGEFGESTAAARELLKEMAQIEMREAQRKARQTSDDLQSQIGIFDGPEFGVGNQKNLADMLDLSVWSREARKEINTVLAAFSELDQAKTLEEQIAAAEGLQLAFRAAAAASGDISESEDVVLRGLNEMVQSLTRVREEQAGTTNEVIRTQGETGILSGLVDDLADSISAISGANISGPFAAAQGPASVLFGIVSGIVDKMAGMAAFRAAQQGLAADGKIYSGRGGDPRTSSTQGYGEFKYDGPPLDQFNVPIVRKGGGGGGAKSEANALQTLITSLQGEIEALRTNDPLQREMLKHREALVGATDAERLKVEELIATREREALAIEGAKARADFFEDIGMNALDSLITKGESFNDVLKNIAQSLIQAALQAALFGSGPFGSLFGGKSIIGQLLPGLGGKAEGGMIYGAGDGTSDSILTRTSVGEFIVNARATARNRHLLEAINAGGLPGYATGGMVGADTRRMGERGGSGLPGSIYMDFRGVQGDREIDMIARRAAAQIVALYDKEGLPVSVKRVSGDPRRTG